MLDSGGFESRQRVLLSEPAVEPSGIGARRLGATYWQAVAAVTRGGVRAAWGDRGGRLRFLGGVTLLRFGPPELRHTGGVVSCRYSIEGGLLALRAGGSVTLAQHRDGDEHELGLSPQDEGDALAAVLGGQYGFASASPSRSTCRGWPRAPAHRGGQARSTRGGRARSTSP